MDALLAQYVSDYDQALLVVNDTAYGGSLAVVSVNVSAAEVALRAIGPSLTSAGVTGALADPVLEFHLTDGSVLTNDSTDLAPPNERESAIGATLDPGAYTAIVRGAAQGDGNAPRAHARG